MQSRTSDSNYEVANNEMVAAEMRGSHNKVLTATGDSCSHDQVEATVTGH